MLEDQPDDVEYAVEDWGNWLDGHEENMLAAISVQVSKIIYMKLNPERGDQSDEQRYQVLGLFEAARRWYGWAFIERWFDYMQRSDVPSFQEAYDYIVTEAMGGTRLDEAQTPHYGDDPEERERKVQQIEAHWSTMLDAPASEDPVVEEQG